MRYKILIYGHPCLREPAQHVARVGAEIKRLAKDMLETMYANRGLGLAAQQIGRQEAICVLDVPPSSEAEQHHSKGARPAPRMPLVLINPRLISCHDEQVGQEGCLSFPEIFVNIKRSAHIVVSFTNLENREQTLEASGLLARAIQHELDHLAGILLVDRMSAVQRAAIAGRLRKLRKEVPSPDNARAR